jgi:hypothetical protein
MHGTTVKILQEVDRTTAGGVYHAFVSMEDGFQSQASLCDILVDKMDRYRFFCEFIVVSPIHIHSPVADAI